MIDRISAWAWAATKLAGRGLLHEWRHRLRALFALIILLQFVIWFGAYWLDATTWLVTAALAAAFLAECFPRLPWLLRHAAVLLLILGLHVYRLDIRFAFALEGLAGEARVRAVLAGLGAGFGEMSPYIWFALGAWAAYLFSFTLLQDRVRILVYVGTSIFLFALVDSYSLHVFWDQVAFIVFSGLGLIILEHFERFRLKHPESWSYLSEYPLTLTLSVIIIVSAVMFIGVLAPNAPPLLTDPYTAYMNWKGKEVVTGGKGYSAVSPSYLQLNSSSGYGRDDSRLGGGFDYDYTEVMRVESSQRTYYRGETKSYYTGSGWEFSDADREGPVLPVALQDPLPAFEWGTTGDVPTVQLEQTFHMSGDRSFPILFGAYPIASLVSLDEAVEARGELEGAGWSPRQGELRWDESLPYPATYSVVSEVPVFAPSVFSADAEYDFSDERWAPYLQLPDSLPERVRHLAREIAAEGTTPYERVKLIEQYLQTRFEYDNRPDLSKGKSPDFVDRFLFEIQSGYCDYFSTAMAVMVRSIGLPARWVKGYTSGSLDIEEFTGLPIEIIDRLEGGTYIVRNADAHSWVEVFFPETGWVPFEPTAGFALPAVMLQEQEQAAALDPLDPLLADQENSAAEQGGNTPPWVVAGMIILAVLAALSVLLLLLLAVRFRRWRGFAALRPRRRSAGANQQALNEVNRMIRMFRRKGYRRYDHETARETFARWAAKNRSLQPDLAVVLDVLEKAKYSGRAVTDEDVARLAQTRRRMKDVL